jgi:hypothetical protein
MKPNAGALGFECSPIFQISSAESAMNVLQNLHRVTFPICALLAVAGVLLISNPTLSEPDAVVPSQEDGRKSAQAKGKLGNGPPRIAWSRFYSPNDDCADAKVDISLTQGVASYSLSVPGAGAGGQRAIARVGAGDEATTILVGAKDCLISIRVGRAPAGTTIDNN